MDNQLIPPMNPMKEEVRGELPSMWEVLTRGDLITKLSFFIQGLNQVRNRQIIKGLLFFLAELIFVVTFIIQVIPALIGLVTLGTVSQGSHMDPATGITFQTNGDNSMLLMIGGLAMVIFVAVYMFVFWCGLKSNRNLYMMDRRGIPAPSLKEDFATLLNGRFHMSLMTIPLVGVLIFTVLPLIYMILLAFTSYDHNHLPPKNLFDWVGLTNFGNVFTGRMAGTFLPVLTWTIIWAVFATVTNFIFGVILAIMINTKGLRLKVMWRTFFVITIALPAFVSLLTMRNVLSSWGPINQFLQGIGLFQGPLPFLTDGTWAKATVILVNMWIGIPFTLLIATGIIDNLPQDQLEAAEIDGASHFQIFKSITFPQILMIMTPYLIQQFIGNINNFNVIYLLTGGGPLNSEFYGAGSTDLLVTWLYKLTVEQADYNLASVVGIIIFALSAVISLLMYTRTKSYKEDLK